MTTLPHSFFINLQEQEPGYIIDDQIFKNEVESIAKTVKLLSVNNYKSNNINIHSMLINVLSFINYISDNLHDVIKQVNVCILMFRLLNTIPVKTFISNHKKFMITLYNDMSTQINKYNKIISKRDDIYLKNSYNELNYLLCNFYEEHLSVIRL